MQTGPMFFHSLAIVAISLLPAFTFSAPEGPENKTPKGPQVPEAQQTDWQQYQDPGVRGAWITNVDSDVLSSRENIAEAMENLAAANFNVVYPVVWNKTMTLYPSEVIPQYLGSNQPELEDPDSTIKRVREAHRTGIDPVYEGRDPLQELIIEAHRVGLEVVPWFEWGFATGYDWGGGPILDKYPDWAAKNQEGELVVKNSFEWMNALDPQVQKFMSDIIMEVVRNYDIDGIQGDDRLPALPSEGGYNKGVVRRYKNEFGEEPPEDTKDPKWVKWRANILSTYLLELKKMVKDVHPKLAISMSPNTYPWTLNEYLQDSKTWADKLLVESLHPQAYRRDIEAYQGLVDEMVAVHGEQKDMLAPGLLAKLGDYRMPLDLLAEKIAYNRKKDINGEVYFFYEGLIEDDKELLDFLAEGPYAEEIRLPYRRADGNWRPDSVVVPVSDARKQGDWKESPAGEEYLQRTGGADSKIVFELEAPIDGTYDLYMKLPKGSDEYTQRAYFVVPNLQVDLSKPEDERVVTGATDLSGSNPMQAKYIDQTEGEESRWVHIAQVEILGGVRYTAASLLTNESGTEKVTIAGPLMLQLNRKAMRSQE